MSAIWVSACLVAAVTAAGLGAACALAGLRMPGRAPIAAPAMVVMAVSCADMVLPDVQLLGPLGWAGLLVGAALLALLDRRHRLPAAHHAASLLLMAVMWAGMLPAASAASTAAAASGALAGPGPAAGAAAGAGAGAGTVAGTTAGDTAGAAAGTAAETTAGTAAGAAAQTTAGTGAGAAGTTATEAPAVAEATTAAAPAAGSGAHAGHGLAITDGGMLLAGLVMLVVAASVFVAASAVRSAHRPGGSGVSPATLRLESAQHLSMAVAMTLMAAGMFLPLAGAGAP